MKLSNLTRAGSERLLIITAGLRRSRAWRPSASGERFDRHLEFRMHIWAKFWDNVSTQGALHGAVSHHRHGLGWLIICMFHPLFWVDVKLAEVAKQKG